MHRIKYKNYPNNEIRVTHYYKAPPKPVNRDGSQEDEMLSHAPVSPAPGGERHADLSPPLDISPEVDAPPAKLIRKRTVFGANAKNTLLRAGGALDTVSQKPYHYVMLTGTLPGGTPDAMQVIADESSWIVHAIGKWLKKYYKSKHWFYVWELQKRGALHIHWCVYLPNTYQRCKLLWTWWDKWHSILQHLQEKTGVDLWRRKDGSYHHKGHSVLQADAQQVYRSVAAYLAGYCSNAKDKHRHDKNCPYFPSRWWGYSRPLKKLLDDLTDTIEVEHTSYRAARYEMVTHYEKVSHDSPKSHHYPHKIGIGSTIVSYHPEDKGNSIWHPLKSMLYNLRHHPNTSFLIATYRRLAVETTSFLEACPKQVQTSYAPLLTTLRGLTFPSAARGYGIAQRDMTVIRMIPSDLNSSLNTVPDWERLRLNWWHLQDSVKGLEKLLTWDRFGNLSNYEDCLKLLDEHPSRRYVSTTDPDGAGDTRGAANGSLSPQTPLPPEQICLFSDL